MIPFLLLLQGGTWSSLMLGGVGGLGVRLFSLLLGGP